MVILSAVLNFQQLLHFSVIFIDQFCVKFVEQHVCLQVLVVMLFSNVLKLAITTSMFSCTVQF